MKKMQKITALLLALAMLLSLASCANDDKETADTKDTADIASEGSTETESEYVSPLNFIDDSVRFDGETFVILDGTVYGTDGTFNEVDILEEDIEFGDIVAESVYNRNLMVEEKLGITIERVIGSWWDTWNEELSVSVMAQDNAYNAICGAAPTAWKSAVEGLLTNYYDVDTIDPENPWWDEIQNECMTFMNKYLFTLAGDINYLDNFSGQAIMLNEDLFEEQQIELPYQLVRDGKWTYDKFYEILYGRYRDINGNGEADEHDSYGIGYNFNFMGYMIRGMGESVIIKDEEGMPIANQSERVVNIVDAFLNDIVGTNDAYQTDDGSYIHVFNAGRMLMTIELLKWFGSGGREVEFESGVVPIPKWDETDDRYYCAVTDAYTSAYCIVNTSSARADMAGYVIEAMGAASVDTVTPSVIESFIINRGSRNEETKEMLELIFASAFYPLDVITNWGGIGGVFTDCLNNKSNLYATRMAKVAKMLHKYTDSDMQALVDKYN